MGPRWEPLAAVTPAPLPLQGCLRRLRKQTDLKPQPPLPHRWAAPAPASTCFGVTFPVGAGDPPGSSALGWLLQPGPPGESEGEGREQGIN